MKWPFVLTLTWFQLYSLWYSYQPPESVGGFFYPTFFNIIHYCTQFEESACNPKKQLACCAFFWRSYAYTLVSELLLLLLRFRSWILRNTKTWALLCGKSHAEKKITFCERILQGALDLMMVWLFVLKYNYFIQNTFTPKT